jgi:hypothetical protein
MYLKLDKIQILFDIGKLEYNACDKLPNEFVPIYLKRFIRKNITVEMFDEFLVRDWSYYSMESKLHNDIIGILGIEVPENFNPRYTQDVSDMRMSDKKFGRDVKLKLLDTWDKS